MKFIINIEKKYLFFLAAMIFVLGIFTVFAATAFKSSSPLHPLQQISIDQKGTTSVDANSNSIIDNSDKLQGLSASQFCRSNGVNCPTSSSSVWTISGSNIYYNTGNVGIGTSSPSSKLHVSGDVKASSITLGGVTKTSWPSSSSPPSIKYVKSASSSRDHMLLCPSTHPVILNCFVGDNQGTLTNLNSLTRTGLGSDFLYLERVMSGNRMGCLSYDKGHDHKSYFIEIVCTNIPYE